MEIKGKEILIIMEILSKTPAVSFNQSQLVLSEAPAENVANAFPGESGQPVLRTPTGVVVSEGITVAEAQPNLQVSFAEQEDRQSLAYLKRCYGVLSAKDIRQECASAQGREHVVDVIIPARSVNILVGDSGLGKTPFCYQMGICIAAGVPFLGYNVKKGRVLYLDYENGMEDIDWIVDQQCKHLELSERPDEFFVWSFNHSEQENKFENMIVDAKPTLAVIDSARSYDPNIDDKNNHAAGTIRTLREVCRESGTAFLLVHHIRKTQEGDVKILDNADLMEWLLRAAGPRALINQTDQATADFLKKCIAFGILKQPCRGQYEKVKVAE